MMMLCATVRSSACRSMTLEKSSCCTSKPPLKAATGRVTSTAEVIMMSPFGGRPLVTENPMPRSFSFATAAAARGVTRFWLSTSVPSTSATNMEILGGVIECQSKKGEDVCDSYLKKVGGQRTEDRGQRAEGGCRARAARWTQGGDVSREEEQNSKISGLGSCRLRTKLFRGSALF